jgi:hypothetical protein
MSEHARPIFYFLNSRERSGGRVPQWFLTLIGLIRMGYYISQIHRMLLGFPCMFVLKIFKVCFRFEHLPNRTFRFS